MTRIEVLEEIIRQEGGCSGINYNEDKCPFSEKFGNGACGHLNSKYRLTTAKKMLAELQCELAREGIDRFDINQLEEEIVDITIMVDQIKIMFGINEEKLNILKKKKLLRTINKIKGLKDE